MTTAEIKMTGTQYRSLRGILFDKGDREGAAFILAGVANGPERFLLTAHDLWEIPSARGAWHIQAEPSALIEAVNRAVEKGAVLIEAHSHPGSDVPHFSSVDEEGLRKVVPYMLGSLTQPIYGATVWGRTGAEARVWMGFAGSPIPVRSIRVVGPDGRTIPMKVDGDPFDPEGCGRWDRLDRAIGTKGRSAIAELTVGIVGLGGLGSHLVTALLAIGVRKFVLVDGDVVKEVNLDRIPYALPRDARRRIRKVLLAKDHIESRLPDALVTAVATGLEGRSAFEALKVVDVLFGAVDAYFPRLIMTTLAAAYLIPYFDCGTGVISKEGKISDMGGRISVLWPGEHCLVCAGRLNIRELNYELADEDGKRFARERGYVTGADVAQPMVGNLNGVVAHLATMELVGVVGGFRKSADQLYYDALRGTVQEISYVETKDCRICKGQLGLADGSDVQSRFIRPEEKAGHGKGKRSVS